MSFARQSLCMIALCVFLCLLCVGLIVAVAILASQQGTQETVESKCDDNKGSDDKEKPEPEASGAYRFASVVSEDYRCNEIGTKMLVRGGSVVDAGIATALCVGVVSPHYAGIGGGFMATVYAKGKQDTNKRVRSLISRETAPGNATPLMFVNSTLDSLEGGGSIAVPGELAGYSALHEMYGTLPWKDLFQPAIELAKGMIVPEMLSHYSQQNIQYFRKYPNLRDVFLKNDEVYKAGEIMKNEKLAKTLETIANEGAKAFYDGSLSQDIVDDIKEQGGIINREDLKQYNPRFKDPIKADILKGKIKAYGPPPPSSAIVIAFILNILEELNVTDSTPADLRIHRLVEAMKFAFGKRSALGDSDYAANMTQWIKSLTSREYAAKYSALIDDDRTFNLSHYEPEFDVVMQSGTSQISVIDANGFALSMTSSINTRFGSKVLGSRTGIIFNNHMDDFSTPGTVNYFGVPSSPSNYIQPGMRPMSSISPLILVDDNGDVRMSVGAAGGTRIITSITQTIINNFVLNMPLAEAISAVRVHHQLMPEKVTYEEGLSKEIQSELVKRGHTIEQGSSHRWFGGAMGIRNRCGEPCNDSAKSCNYCVKAATDWRVDELSRKAPQPDGY